MVAVNPAFNHQAAGHACFIADGEVGCFNPTCGPVRACACDTLQTRESTFPMAKIGGGRDFNTVEVTASSFGRFQSRSMNRPVCKPRQRLDLQF